MKALSYNDRNITKWTYFIVRRKIENRDIIRLKGLTLTLDVTFSVTCYYETRLVDEHSFESRDSVLSS